MKRFCSKHGSYSYSLSRCPKCLSNAYDERNKAHKKAGYHYDHAWKKFRAELIKEELYGFCWLTFLETGQIRSDNLQLHHIVKITEDESLRLDRLNVVPICAEKHNSMEQKIKQGEAQPDWSSVRLQVMMKLEALKHNL